jgi:hypothetical protein
MQITHARSPQSIQPKINDVVTNNDISRHDEAVTIAGTTSFKLYVTVTIDSVMTNDDAINISEVTENMNMTISVTTAAMFKRSHINSPTQSDPTASHRFSEFYPRSRISEANSKTATPSPAIIVVLKLTNATNGALSLDFITVSNK